MIIEGEVISQLSNGDFISQFIDGLNLTKEIYVGITKALLLKNKKFNNLPDCRELKDGDGNG